MEVTTIKDSIKTAFDSINLDQFRGENNISGNFLFETPADFDTQINPDNQTIGQKFITLLGLTIRLEELDTNQLAILIDNLNDNQFLESLGLSKSFIFPPTVFFKELLEYSKKIKNIRESLIILDFDTEARRLYDSELLGYEIPATAYKDNSNKFYKGLEKEGKNHEAFVGKIISFRAVYSEKELAETVQKLIENPKIYLSDKQKLIMGDVENHETKQITTENGKTTVSYFLKYNNGEITINDDSSMNIEFGVTGGKHVIKIDQFGNKNESRIDSNIFISER
jgi:hypothetical protein